MAVRDGINAHFVWGNPVCAYSENSGEGRCILFDEGTVYFC